MTRPYTKPVLSLEQQVLRLKERGLRIEDQQRALTTLSLINYYRLSAYWLPFKLPDDRFHPDGSFDKAVGLYEFDRTLRLALMDMIERVEVALRAQVSYRIASQHGTYGHENPNLFSKGKVDHDKWLKELHIETERSKETFASHFRQKYDGFPRLPIFVVSELMSFGCLSRLYQHLNTDDSLVLAQPYGIHPSVFKSWIHSLVFIRNTCAHHGRLWNRDLPIAPAIPRGHSQWLGQYFPNKKRIHVVLCVLRSLSHGHPYSDEWATMIVNLLSKFDNEPRWQKSMGLPPDWRNIPFWQEVSTNQQTHRGLYRIPIIPGEQIIS